MKKTLCITVLAIALAMGSGNVHAQMAGKQMMEQNQQQSHHPDQKDQQKVQPGMTGNSGTGMMGSGMMGNSGMGMMGPGMMGNSGMGMMGPGMMGNSGMGMMGPGMMGNRGMGMMGPGMMGNRGMGMMGPGVTGCGMMMGSPMMGFAAGMDNAKISQYENFIKETRKMRKKLYDMRFDYNEALWNPNTTLKDLQEKLTKMSQLQKDIQQKIPR